MNHVHEPVGSPVYPGSNEPVHVGDRIRFGELTGRIVIVSATSEYDVDYPKDAWSFVSSPMIAVLFEDGHLLMYSAFCPCCDDVELLARDRERQALEGVRAWLEGNARWFALEDQDGFAVIACGDNRLRDFVDWPMPPPTTATEVTAIANCRAFLAATGRAYGRLELSKGMYAHFGTKSALADAVVVSPIPLE